MARGYGARRILRKPLSTTNHFRFGLDWDWGGRTWLDCLAPRHLGIWVTFAAVSCRWPHESSSTAGRTQDCQADRVQAGGGSVHVWGAFLKGAKSSLVLLDSNVHGVVYQDILRDTLLPFARQHFGDNFGFQDDNTKPHHFRVVTDYLQQGDINKMDQPAQSSDCIPIEHLCDELGRAINNMDHPPHNLHELPQALLDQWAKISVERLQRLVASMPR